MRFSLSYCAMPIIALLMLSACRSAMISTNHKTTCAEFEKFVTQNWHIDSSSQCYYHSPKFFNDSGEFVIIKQYKQCAMALDTTQVKKLFGNPSAREGNNFLYYREKSCFARPKRSCAFFSIRFNREGYFADIEWMTVRSD